MKITEWISKNFKDFLIIALLAFIAFKQFGKPAEVEHPIVVTHSDTTYISHTGEISSQPPIINVLPPKVILPKYVPSENYDSLRRQFTDLRDQFLARNIHRDTLKLDTLGTVEVTDTVTENKIAQRLYKYNIKERLIETTTTITQPYKPRNQLYIGTEIGGTTAGAINQADIGAFFKNKKDVMLGASIGWNFLHGEGQYKVKLYKKLNFK